MKMHHIQKHVLKTLMYTKWARFRDMRPPKVDSNAYSYHLKSLLKDGLVEKGESGYRLSPAGLMYVDKVSMENLEPRLQPKIITMMIVENEYGEILFFEKTKQPFIGALMMPFGKVHLDDESLQSAASRELKEKIKLTLPDPKHVGDCYIRAKVKDHLVWNVLAHLFYVKVSRDDITAPHVEWLDSMGRDQRKLIPAAKWVIHKVQNSKQFFFDEFDVDW